MPDASSTPDAPITQPRDLPAVHVVAGALDSEVPEALRTRAARAALDVARTSVLGGAAVAGVQAVIAEAARQLARREDGGLPRVLNGTGILLHTGLGRARLAAPAVEAVRRAAAEAVPVELNMDGGTRGKRDAAVRQKLVALTGAEAATTVNNAAAALLLSLAALSRDKRVVVSRGELVEIGGSFRLPEIIEAGGARLHEVGTTNRTRIADFARAFEVDVDDADGDGDGGRKGDSVPGVGAILRVHPSNFRVEGFTAEASVAELATLARERGVPMIHDAGSGRLDTRPMPGLPDDEPSVNASIRDGADLVLFSGDKLLGGPQAGLIVGRRDLVERLDRHPMKRAMRCDKLRLAGLLATLEIHAMGPDVADATIPAWVAARVPLAALQARAESLANQLGDHVGVTACVSHLGGGTAPGTTIESCGLAIRGDVPADELAGRLRAPAKDAIVPLLPRIERDAVVIDLRGIEPAADEDLLAAVRAAVGQGR